MLTFTITISSLFAGCFGQAGQTGRYPDKYNLIDADPSCRYDIPDDVCCVSGRGAQCPEIYDGPGDVDVMAIHPNVFERTEFLMRNMARLFSTFYADSEWGWGGSYAGNCNEPSTLPTKPFYFMSEATQAARWNAFSGATEYSGCDRGDYDSCQNAAQTAHFTCCDYCTYNSWQQCGYKYRTKAMVQLLFTSNAWNDVGSEGIWCCNSALISSSAHCGMVFNYEYEHQGVGYYPNGGVTMVGIKDTDDWEDHVFPHATHFDWSDDKYTFLVQFFGGKKSTVAYIDELKLLYNGQLIDMDTVIESSSSTTGTSGFYKSEQTNTQSCEPYAFVAKDTNGNIWRLPEDENYYFSTVSSPDDLVDNSADCNENHYYYTGSQWVANGADGLTNSKNSNNGCVGCSKISSLESLFNDFSDGSYDDGDDSDGSDDDSGDDSDDSGSNNDYTCDDGCEINPTWWQDGRWCDCPNCEDEDSCACPSSGCPTYCGGWTSGTCTSSVNSDASNRDGSGSSNNSNNNDDTVEIAIYVSCAVGLVILIAIVAVCVIRKRRKDKTVAYNAMEDSKPGYKPPQVEQTS